MMKESELFPFGKYKDEKLGDVPASYLLWWCDEQGEVCRYPDLLAYIKANKQHLIKDAKEERYTSRR